MASSFAGAGAGSSAASTGDLDPPALRLFRVRKTLCKMLTKRGYVVAPEDLHMTAADFRAKFGASPSGTSLNFLAIRSTSESDRIVAYFADGNVSVKECMPFLEQIKAMDATGGILVVAGKFGAAAKSLLVDAAPIVVEVFKMDELLIDITEHDLVPEHVVLTPDEKAALLERYKLRETQLPRILLGDPVARYYGLQRGQVVKIIRPSETAGRYVTYRIAV